MSGVKSSYLFTELDYLLWPHTCFRSDILEISLLLRFLACRYCPLCRCHFIKCQSNLHSGELARLSDPRTFPSTSIAPGGRVGRERGGGGWGAPDGAMSTDAKAAIGWKINREEENSNGGGEKNKNTFVSGCCTRIFSYLLVRLFTDRP